MAVVRDPRLLENLERDSSPVANWGDIGAPMPTPLSNIETRPSPYPQHEVHIRDYSFIDRKYIYSNIYVYVYLCLHTYIYLTPQPTFKNL